ncbi:MAG: DNA polymerase III subunit delta [Gammaproteobacteria bacterium]|jgi:DNA polymerase III subunit delta
MKLRPDQLHQHLQKAPAPVYLVTGDEPLQLLEAADDIRRSAKAHGYAERQVMEAGAGFDWNSLAREADALSLFSALRLLDLRVPSGKPGREGGQAICDYLDRPSEDTLLLITMPKLDRSQQSGKWFRAIDSRGVVVQVWPVNTQQMPGWIRNRAEHHGLRLSPDAIQLLAQHTEGNLLAAAQELDKLRLNYGVGNLSVDQVMESVSGHAHFTVFELVDAALAGDAPRGIRILRSLQAEGTPEPVVLWALGREIQLLAEISEAMQQRRRLADIFKKHRAWQKRQQAVTDCARRISVALCYRLLELLADIDDTIKGRPGLDPWLQMEQLVLRMRRDHHRGVNRS